MSHTQRPSMSARLLRLSGVLAAWTLLVAPSLASAQGGDWPTLSGAGVEYISGSGFLQVSLSGQLDYEAFHVNDSWNGLLRHSASQAPVPEETLSCLACHEGTAFAGPGGRLGAHRLRVFADVFLGDHVYTLMEVRSDRGAAPTDGPTQTRIEQAFVRLTAGTGSAGLQLGRFASPFGSYPLRHLTVVDPFLRPPLAYDYRTTMSTTLAPVSAPQLVNWRSAPHFFRAAGAPPVWEVPYQWGAMLFGSVGPLDLRLAAMNSAPSSAPAAWAFEWSRLDHPSVVAGARAKLGPSLELGMSYNRGPWMERLVVENPEPGFVPPSLYDFDQELVSADFSFAQGPMMLRGEVIRDQWDVPNLEAHPTEVSYSLELQWDLWAGVSAATRVGYLDFRPLEGDAGLGYQAEDWDYDVYRYEGSLGYRLARNAGILVSAYRQIQRTGEDGDTHLIGARMWWAF